MSVVFKIPGFVLACENIRFSSLFAAGDVSCETSPAAKSVEKQMFSQARFLYMRFLPFFPTPSPLFTRAIFGRSLTLVTRSLLLNRTETLATQVTGHRDQSSQSRVNSNYASATGRPRWHRLTFPAVVSTS